MTGLLVALVVVAGGDAALLLWQDSGKPTRPGQAR